MAKNNSGLQRPMQHWSAEYRRVVSEDGRVAYLPRNQATGGSTIDFACNIATAVLLVYWSTQSGLAFFNNYLVGAILFFVLVIWQHDSWTRWPLRCVVWATFWGMWHLGLHWIPLFH